MTEIRTMSPQKDDGGAPQQRAHVMREKWEESWLAQQRKASAVVEYPGEEITSPRIPSAQQQPAPEEPDGFDRRFAAAASNVERRTSGSASAHALPLSEAGTARTPANPPVVISGSPGAARAQAASRIGAAQTGVAQSADPLRPAPAFAFWRQGEAVEVAMRLRDPDSSARPVLAQLRQWLRDCGAHLRRALINGQVVSQESPPGGPESARDPAGAARRHTYI